MDRASFFRTFDRATRFSTSTSRSWKPSTPSFGKTSASGTPPPKSWSTWSARVDRVLREELGGPDGLADPRVYVLDPCCGTGAFLVEVLHRIAATLRDKGGDALLAHDLKRAAVERVFGFEILPAPFVVAHLQIGLLLQAFGAPLSGTRKERVGVFLTNALTGWEPP